MRQKSSLKTEKTDAQTQTALLSEFEKPTSEAWQQAAIASLKGASFEKKLVSKTPEHISIQPIYTAADIRDLGHQKNRPGTMPYVRGASQDRDPDHPWRICQDAIGATPKEIRATLAHDVHWGQTAIRLVFDWAVQRRVDPDAAPKDSAREGVSIASLAELQTALGSVDLTTYPIYLDAGAAFMAAGALFFAHLRASGVPFTSVAGCIESDPLGVLSRRGQLPVSLAQAYDEMAGLTCFAIDNAPDLKTIAVRGHPYSDAGGSAVQELAAVIATAAEYLREMTRRGLNIDDLSQKIHFAFSIGGDFFMEVAKLRAARMLFTTLISAFGGSTEAQQLTIYARTSAWTKTRCDPHVNMLRSTAETFSAAVGGADVICTGPFDELIQAPTEFSRRIARNVQIILQEESHVGHVVDPAGGSYYVEHQTDAIAAQAWTLFQEIEGEGGMRAALANGFVQRAIAATATARAQAIESRASAIVGTNIYPDTNAPLVEVEAIELEQAGQMDSDGTMPHPVGDANRPPHVAPLLDRLAQSSPTTSAKTVVLAIDAANSGATIGHISQALATGMASTEQPISPLCIHRAAETYERLRMATYRFAQKTGKQPAVFLANMGPIPKHKARADFSTGFFEVGGFDVIGNDGFATPALAADAAAASGAAIAVICATDDAYPDLVPPFVKRLRATNNKMKIVLAGYPKGQIDAHKAAGVDAFIHMKSNNYKVLAECLEEIGVTL
ncbi:MAG: methylmalonyl-CoA mutase family protein [Myxococcota bacterium]|nr:methylmalonyl-CoA mutase family protein [Myxococcota bacterium]